VLLASFALFGLLAAAPFDGPTVIIFPLQSSASLPRDVSSRIVTVLGNQIAQDGKVHVITGDPDTPRSDYLSAARKAGAAYYVTGYLTPLGEGASIIDQLVSATSGTIVFSNSAQISNGADIAAQGDVLRFAVLDRVSRGFASLPTPPPAGTNTPSPARGTTTPPPEANIGGLFHHRRPADQPSPSPSPSAAAPAASPQP
jgi:hypothetical protein